MQVDPSMWYMCFKHNALTNAVCNFYFYLVYIVTMLRQWLDVYSCKKKLESHSIRNQIQFFYSTSVSSLLAVAYGAYENFLLSRLVWILLNTWYTIMKAICNIFILKIFHVTEGNPQVCAPGVQYVIFIFKIKITIYRCIWN